MANEVSIRRENLLLALKPLRLVRSPKNAWEALISMEGDSLCFSVIGIAPYVQEILRLAFHYAPERVERAGLKKRVEEAQTRAAKLLDLAAVTLAPLGITRTDLRDLLLRKLRSPPSSG